MSETHSHLSHPKVSARLKRAKGHLAPVIGMIGDGRPCAEAAQQLHAVEKAVTQAKRKLFHDRIDHCLNPETQHDAEDFRAITRYL